MRLNNMKVENINEEVVEENENEENSAFNNEEKEKDIQSNEKEEGDIFANSIYSNSLNKSSKSLMNKSQNFAKKFKSMPSTVERDFLRYYNQTENKIKDKEIKYIQFIGKKLLKDDQINRIIKDRIKDYENELLIKKNIDLTRFKFELDTAKCCVDKLNKYFMKPTFNFNLNDKFFKTRHYFRLFHKLMTKIIIRARGNKNLNSIKNMFQKNNIRNAKDFSEYSEKDWALQLTKDQETQESKTKIKFFKPKNMLRAPVYLCYDYNLESLKQEMGHENNINLEELHQYKKFDSNDSEVVGHKGKKL
jgi:hypothetical protein